jgi:D-glycero-alpha-D-manno-heptose-7-phosphate kinase
MTDIDESKRAGMAVTWPKRGGLLGKIRSRAPLRLGLAGGGTDVSPFSEDFGGAVLNATVNRYARAFIEPGNEAISFCATDLSLEETFPANVDIVASTKLPIHAAVHRNMMSRFGGSRRLAITVKTSVDAPSGSGLGSSSALVVALVEAYCTLLDVPLGPYEVAHLAFEIERIDLALAGGKQDHYAAAFGGLNFIEFLAGDRVIVNPLRISRSALNELESSLLICFSGVSRRSDQIINQQRKGMSEKSANTLDNLRRLKSDAFEMKNAMLRTDIPEMARILNSSWLAKRETATGISTTVIETLLDTAMKAGALAGKVSGAGGGGFIMFIVPPEKHLVVARALNAAGADVSNVQFTMEGAESWISPNGTL